MATNSKIEIIGEGFLIEKDGRKRNTFKCKCFCGELFEVRQYSINLGKTKSCGCLQKSAISKIGKRTGKINCKKAHLSNRGRIGKLNKNYKGKTSLGVVIRNSLEYIDWRTKCFQRDNYTCQISGQKSGDIIVHHLNPFSIIISDLDIETFRECELLWELENGITMTRELHNKFHKIYGKKGFTKENFIEFNQEYNGD